MSVGSNGTRPPNLIVVVLDCIRAKSLAVGGGQRVARTPVIDALAGTGSVFGHAVAPANWTVPSHMSMMTGVYPAVHRLRTFRKGEPTVETFATWVQRQGYSTVLFTEQVHLVAGYGLESGYTERYSPAMKANTRTEDRNASRQLFAHSNLLYAPTVRKLISSLPPAVIPINMVNHPQEAAYKSRVCGDEIVGWFREWLAQRDPNRPFHAFFNFVNGHEPYPRTAEWSGLGRLARWYARTPRYYLLAVPELHGVVPWREFEGGYLLAVEDADRKLGALLTALEETGERGRSLLIVTSDHGQSFGERGHVFHGNGAVESVTRVPLVVVPPDGSALPRRIDRWFSLCELPSWLQAASAGHLPFDESGHAPLPFGAAPTDGGIVYCEGNPASDSNRSLRGIGSDQRWNHRLLAAYRNDEKWVLDLETGELERWVGRGDPDYQPSESIDASERERLRREIFGAYEALGPPAPSLPKGATELESSVDERLRSWGYD